MHKMIWFERSNPDNRGEGEPIEDAAEAEKVCRDHNWLYPKFRHKAVYIDETNTTER